ncbi:MAG: hypothetical protein ACE5E9_01025 [Nitrospinaceae bacterium]
MKKKFTIELDQKLYQRLHDHFKGNEKALKEFVARALENQLAESTGSKPGPGTESLEDYLKKGKPGSRSYGVKGQGW